MGPRWAIFYYDFILPAIGKRCAVMPFDYHEFEEAHRRYQGYRDAAFDLTLRQLKNQVPPGCDLRLLPIDDEALGVAGAVRSFEYVHPDGGFPWERIFEQVRSTPRRFDIAVWDGNVLCGLAVGMASKGDENVTVKWLERFEVGPNHLRGFVAEAAFTAADHYAAILGKRLLKIKNPLPGASPLYQNLQFRLAGAHRGCLYMERSVARP